MELKESIVLGAMIVVLPVVFFNVVVPEVSSVTGGAVEGFFSGSLVVGVLVAVVITVSLSPLPLSSVLLVVPLVPVSGVVSFVTLKSNAVVVSIKSVILDVDMFKSFVIG